jgi:hypothetical protein
MRILSHTNLDFRGLVVNIRNSMNHDKFFQTEDGFPSPFLVSEADATRCIRALCKQVDSRSWRLAQETGLVIEAGDL